MPQVALAQLANKFDIVEIVNEHRAEYIITEPLHGLVFDSLPARLPALNMIIRWEGRKGETFQERIEIFSPTGQMVFSNDDSVRPVSLHNGIDNFALRFNNVDFTEPGEHVIRVFSNHILRHSLTLTVHVKSLPDVGN
jgi:uncharacterized protein DUF6941